MSQEGFILFDCCFVNIKSCSVTKLKNRKVMLWNLNDRQPPLCCLWLTIACTLSSVSDTVGFSPALSAAVRLIKYIESVSESCMSGCSGKIITIFDTSGGGYTLFYHLSLF